MTPTDAIRALARRYRLRRWLATVALGAGIGLVAVALAHRSAAHSEPRGDLGLDDAAARLQRSLHDQVPQSRVHMIGPRAVRRSGQ